MYRFVAPFAARVVPLTLKNGIFNLDLKVSNCKIV